jgi:signal transduction histidine kinase
MYQNESQKLLAEARPLGLYAGARVDRVPVFLGYPAMTQLSLATSNAVFPSVPPHQWAHDIRNLLGTIGLHLEALEKLSGPAGAKAARAALALIGRGGAMCAGALAEATRARPSGHRRCFDLAKTIKEVVALLEPTAPTGFKFRVDGNEALIVLGDQTEVFRILFNLAQNAVMVARRGAPLSHLTIAVTRGATGISVRIADDGPGLPKAVRAKLFLAPDERGSSGFGLAIARELTERNGGTLAYVDGMRGATFVLEFPHAGGREIPCGAAMPSLGCRAAG